MHLIKLSPTRGINAEHLLKWQDLPEGGVAVHLRVLKHMNYDGQDQHGLPIEWCVRS